MENVKLSRYNFPKKPSISKELKALLEGVFILNYDDRLTLDEISEHPFFQISEEEERKLKNREKGFSLTKLFSSTVKEKVEERPRRISERDSKRKK